MNGLSKVFQGDAELGTNSALCGICSSPLEATMVDPTVIVSSRGRPMGLQVDSTADRLEALTRLLEVALELSQQSDLDVVLPTVTRGVCQAVGCERASLFLYDAVREELFTRVATELEISEIRHPVERGIVGWVARHGELLSVPQPALDPRWDASVDRRTGFRTRNILAAPIHSSDGERLLGVLQLLNKPQPFDELDELLLKAFAGHVAAALDRVRWEAEARSARMLRQSLEMGQSIQRGLLPAADPAIPGYEVAHWWEPTEFVSGDYFDWLPLPIQDTSAVPRWAFAMGDVSGHGLPAALVMTGIRAMVHVMAQTAVDPESLLQLLRASTEPDLAESRFLSFFYLSLDPVTHQVSAANAGHAPAFLLRAVDGSCHNFRPTSVPIGFPHVELPRVELSAVVEPGDLLVLGTDGLIEARSPDDEMFGQLRLQVLLGQCRELPAPQIVDRVRSAVLEFRGATEFDDDITLVVIRRTPSN
jgi:phosphoserine phosphatase RsbU/P